MPVWLAGYSGLKSDFQSENGFEKTTLTSWSDEPLVTDAMSSYPVVAPTRYSWFDPLSAFHWFSKSFHVMGDPSFHFAFGLIVYSIVSGSSLVASAFET